MLNIVTALNSEAQPIIEHFSLVHQQTHRSMRVYAKSNLRLIISGIGKVNSAAAVGYLAGLSENVANGLNNRISGENAWINIGIAGHPDAAIGQCFIVDKVSSGNSGSIAYPSIPYKTEISSAALCTVESPELSYPHNSLYDMEGHAFFSAAQRFSSVELIAILKIVSDNKQHTVEKIDKAFVKTLIGNAIAAIEFTNKTLLSLAAVHISETHDSDISWTDKWRTTHSQNLILCDLQHRLTLLNKDIDVISLVRKCHSADDAIAALNDTLANTPLQLNPAT